MRSEMRFYKGGVLGCRSGQARYKNHQVAVVGYRQDFPAAGGARLPVFIIKNS
jgi:hypothetical protein